MAQVVCPETHTSGWVWFALVVAIIALILVIVIYIFYFVERDDFLRVSDPTWTIVAVDPSNKTITGENFTLYTVTGNAGVAQGDVITLSTPSEGSTPGASFIISNLNDKTITVQASAGVTFQAFPTSGTPGVPTDPATTITPPFTPTNVALLPAGASWIIAWLDTQGTALNIVPGDGPPQS